MIISFAAVKNMPLICNCITSSCENKDSDAHMSPTPHCHKESRLDVGHVFEYIVMQHTNYRSEYQQHRASSLNL